MRACLARVTSLYIRVVNHVKNFFFGERYRRRQPGKQKNCFKTLYISFQVSYSLSIESFYFRQFGARSSLYLLPFSVSLSDSLSYSQTSPLLSSLCSYYYYSFALYHHHLDLPLKLVMKEKVVRLILILMKRY